MASDTFNYARSFRYASRKVKTISELVTAGVQKPITESNVNEVKFDYEELVAVYKAFQIDNRREFNEIDEETADAQTKAEDKLMADLDALTKIVKQATAKAKTYISEYEALHHDPNVSVNLNASNAAVSGVKHPKIDIPEFDGQPDKFLEFAAIFENLVHFEPDIPKIKKLVLLKKACKGKAHDLIEHIPLTDNGYDRAWSSLNTTYRNMRRIIRKHFDDLFIISRIKNATEITDLYTNVTKALKGLEACNLNVDEWSPIISYIVSEKMDEKSYEEFEKSLTSNSEFPSWDLLRTFLEKRCSITKRKSDSKSDRTEKPKSLNQLSKRVSALSTSSKFESKPKTDGNGRPKCIVCSQAHLLIDCDVFKAKSPRERFECIKSKSICRNCFNSNHKVNTCLKSPNCKRCKLPHHTLLHFDEEKSTSEAESKPTEDKTASVACVTQPNELTSNSSLLTVCKPIVLLPTAVVKFRAGNKTGEMRVLLDSGSQINLITKSFIDRNKLTTSESRFVQKVAGINDTEQVCKRNISMTIESQNQPFKYDTTFNIIATKIPYSIADIQSTQLSADLTNYKLADPAYYESSINIPEIDALLGIQAYDYIVGGDVLRLGSITLRSTKLGWTVSSTIYPESTKRVKPNTDSSLCCLCIDRIDERLKLFWETEEISPAKIESTETDTCNAHFERTYQRGEDGKFIVRLPFKRDPASIIGNYDRALLYQKRVEKRLTEPTTTLYADFMQEYIDLGHMTLIPNADYSSRYFIPHHAVMKPSSTTTKLRVVFHASFESYLKRSLNDILMVGPVLQPELFDTLLRFRTYEFVVTGDVTKMYRCVLVHSDDRRYQSIIWNNNIYELNTVTYGTVPASFLATKCLQILADQSESIDPIVAFIIRYCFYMDDLMMGADSIKNVIHLREAVHRILASAGFILRKYQSNSTEILQSIEPELIETKLTKTFGENESLSILGLTWTPKIDIFQPKADLNVVTDTITKRLMLSTIAKIFDPLGLAAPVIIRGKLMLQRTWKLGLTWDISVPEELAAEFRSYVHDLIELKQFSCPRYVGTGNTTYLIGFADASELAYCAAVYVLTRDSGVNRSELLCSKTRVAPVKSLTIPQLELQAAVLLVELVDRARKTIIVPNDRVYLYSDSMIVLSWLAQPPSDWKIFVRNRVAKIVSNYPIDHWNHVASKQNPADIATRGISTDSLINSSLWKNGPEFLHHGKITRTSFEIDDRCLLYLSKPKATVLLITENSDYKLIYSCSSYMKLLRIFATAKLLARRKRTKSNEPIAIMTRDIEFAESYVIRVIQQHEFADDYQRLTDNRKLCKRSRLRTLTPFIDKFGLIRSRSRLQNANIPFNSKCPIVLPAKGHLVTILVRHIHEKYFHANRPFLMSHLSTRFAFVGGLSRSVKDILYKCVTCRRYFAQSKPQQMANLPADRVNPRSPFEVVGIDFTGAFTVKCNFHRAVKYAKSYASIFVCMVTRAIHIEVVPSLSTEDFLNALKCFVARRGLPRIIYSDNGSNFNGANRYLNLRDDNISRYAAENRIEWKFNPPYTPHRGGIWEAAVKSAKRFLPIVTKGQTFTDNELRVFLTQIEGLLNSRPIAYRKSSEPSEEILTPGHFLIGRNITTVPEPSSGNTIKLSTQYRANRKRIEDFWKIWSTDYLNQLKRRGKWIDAQPNLTIGQIGLYKTANNPPSKWPLARVLRCFPDSSNIVRTVEIMVNGQTKIIPTIHLIHLPIE